MNKRRVIFDQQKFSLLIIVFSMLLTACGSFLQESYTQTDVLGDWVQDVKYGTDNPGILCTQFHFDSNGTFTSINIPTWQFIDTSNHEVLSAKGTWELNVLTDSPRIEIKVRDLAETGRSMFTSQLFIERKSIASREIFLLGGNNVDSLWSERLVLKRNNGQGCK